MRGFSLVELSIVLVILGLLVGGVLSGQSLIRAAELRSITSDLNRYNAALYSFKDKYFGWPGDIANATSFWGTDPGGCPSNTSLTGQSATCNGDANGSYLGSDNLTQPNEAFHAWQQLADAGLVEGSYAGNPGPVYPGSARQAIIGVNVPKSRVGNAGYSFYCESTPGHADRFDASFPCTIEFGTATTAYETDLPAIKPEEAWNIDTKMDDGQPGTGKVVTYKGGGPSNYQPNCATTGDPSTSAYNLTYPSIACNLQFAIFR